MVVLVDIVVELVVVVVALLGPKFELCQQVNRLSWPQRARCQLDLHV